MGGNSSKYMHEPSQLDWLLQTLGCGAALEVTVGAVSTFLMLHRSATDCMRFFIWSGRFSSGLAARQWIILSVTCSSVSCGYRRIPSLVRAVVWTLIESFTTQLKADWFYCRILDEICQLLEFLTHFTIACICISYNFFLRVHKTLFYSINRLNWHITGIC